MPTFHDIDVLRHNSASWDAQAARDCEWSRPVSAEEVAAARRGDWAVKLTPGALPAHWLGDVRGREILCLASAGGQQAPILAAAGARVTLFDASAGQLDKDRQVAARDRLELACVQGDMRDLSTFADASFDLVFNPISNLYVDDVLPVWRECARVLRPGGKLLASFYNPALFIEDRSPELAEQGLIRPRHRLPYSDLESHSAEALAAKREKGEALVFGHSLTQQIAGQLAAGLLLQDFYEDWQPHPRFVIDRFMPTFLATCALKPRSAAG
ncbi:class I SAM-dependent methyltransferase [Pseudomonas aeruginosa]|uniref:class I SAM-dependent methyltransferase n=1 Tax=Pseudomonas aeruginosa TaxID=287 RepID=UPI00044810D5|nr:class I SAM-dependent methyltransferase [Pseudomonas aeruginosa]EKX6767977.1 class I SAM-dependent methyltransferase [Pseudomonas aeruginosa]ELP1326655.1 class I SAM-dependent methyltransferase [Pseudomonas aeruginosa]EZO06352.1 methyltransferase [Pseudomonas aeruginosa 3579]EZO13297.1 methyltransferase [Pseudomonas aeruginosa 3578]MBG5772276.1 class I SAM-dependent methyltransferase [Pseudomonas aeruginosa]